MRYLVCDGKVPPEYGVKGALQLSLMEEEGNSKEFLYKARRYIKLAEIWLEYAKDTYHFDPKDPERLEELGELFHIPRQEYQRRYKEVYRRDPMKESEPLADEDKLLKEVSRIQNLGNQRLISENAEEALGESAASICASPDRQAERSSNQKPQVPKAKDALADTRDILKKGYRKRYKKEIKAKPMVENEKLEWSGEALDGFGASTPCDKPEAKMKLTEESLMKVSREAERVFKEKFEQEMKRKGWKE